LERFLDDLDLFCERAHRASKRRALAPIERKLERAMQRAFRRQGRLFVQRFGALRGEFSEALNEGKWLAIWLTVTMETGQLFEDPIQVAARAALLAAGTSMARDLRAGEIIGSFDLKNPRAVAYLREHGAALVTRINETTREEIKRIVTQGVDEGWSYDRMAKEITKRFEEFAIGKPQQHIRSRAHLVAVTEAGEAYEAGNWIVAQDLRDAGVEMEKYWSTMGDDRVSAGCQANQADGWIPIDQEHSSGHMHPLRFPGCRCDELFQRVGSGG